MFVVSEPLTLLPGQQLLFWKAVAPASGTNPSSAGFLCACSSSLFLFMCAGVTFVNTNELPLTSQQSPVTPPPRPSAGRIVSSTAPSRSLNCVTSS